VNLWREIEEVHATLQPLSLCNRNGAETRAEFKQMACLGDKAAQMLLSRLLRTGLMESDIPLGPVRFGLPLDALQLYFPDLYPESSDTAGKE